MKPEIIKEQYIKTIAELLPECDNVNILDIIMKLLIESKQSINSF